MNTVFSLSSFPYITGEDPTSFAAFTLRNRLPKIVDQIIGDNDFDDSIVANLNELKHLILHGNLDVFIENELVRVQWQNWLKPWIGKTWFEVQFYFAEAFFYQLILEKTGFFKSGKDPFKSQKIRDILENRELFGSILMDFEHFSNKNPDQDRLIKYLLQVSLWGNKADLSQVVTDRYQADITGEAMVLDESFEIVKFFAWHANQIDIILDNSGVELFSDLILAAGLLTARSTKTVVLHAKKYPTFVSDATCSDITDLIQFMKNHENKLVIAFGNRLEDLIRKEVIQLEDHDFWNAPLHFRDIPNDLLNKLNRADLMILKGDANYRRIFEDRKIPANTKMSSLNISLPVPTTAIRILKSELIVGMDSVKVQALEKKDPEWLVNGRHGLIQMVKKKDN